MINVVNGFRGLGYARLGESKAISSGENIFSKVIEDSINKINDYKNVANETLTSFIKGEENEIHNVMIAMEEAKLTIQTAIEIRNKIIEAYQELSRTQM